VTHGLSPVVSTCRFCSSHSELKSAALAVCQTPQVVPDRYADLQLNPAPRPAGLLAQVIIGPGHTQPYGSDPLPAMPELVTGGGSRVPHGASGSSLIAAKLLRRDEPPTCAKSRRWSTPMICHPSVQNA
jgi:hypothetical protein